MSRKKKIKTMNSKMTTNSQPTTTKPKTTTRTGTESQKLRSHGGLSVGRKEKRGKGTGNKKQKW